MKFCHKCGAQCEDGAKFCKQCGAALADVNANQSQQTYEVPRQAQYTSADTNNSQNAYGNQNNYGNQNQYGELGRRHESEIPGNPGEKYCDCSHSFDCNMRTLWNLLDDQAE
ncbi:MAG: zinc-ribbon domain-containing protein [Dorea formicigenerans]